MGHRVQVRAVLGTVLGGYIRLARHGWYQPTTQLTPLFFTIHPAMEPLYR